MRRAFSLLELILALALSVVVVAAITTAIYQYMFHLSRQQAEIERKQVARGVVRMLTEDLRAAIQYKPEDYSALENLIESQSLAGIGGLAGVDEENIDQEELEQQIVDAVADQNSGTATAGGLSSESAPAAQSSGDEATGDTSEETEEEPAEEGGRPTLIGNEFFVRVDTSRLPRLDEYNPIVSRRATEQSLPSDVKTITWFFSTSPPQQQDALSTNFGQRGGLYRRKIDRAVESYRGEEYIDPRPDQFCELISPEIAAIRLRYWNGEEWRIEWDSSQESGFPLAVEMEIVIDPERTSDENRLNDQFDQLETYRTVVHLPVAEILPEEEEQVQ